MPRMSLRVGQNAISILLDTLPVLNIRNLLFIEFFDIILKSKNFLKAFYNDKNSIAYNSVYCAINIFRKCTKQRSV